MHRGAEIWRGVSGATFGEDPPEALSGTTQVEQSDEHLVILYTWERKRAKPFLCPLLKPLHS